MATADIAQWAVFGLFHFLSAMIRISHTDQLVQHELDRDTCTPRRNLYLASTTLTAGPPQGPRYTGAATDLDDEPTNCQTFKYSYSGIKHHNKTET